MDVYDFVAGSKTGQLFDLLKDLTFAKPITYKPARLCKGKEWYVTYSVLHPTTDFMVRKRIKLMRIKSERERERFGLKLVHKLNEMLERGWNPFNQEDTSRGLITIQEAMKEFLAAKQKEQRDGGFRSYRSQGKYLLTYLDEISQGKLLVSNFTEGMAADLMAHIWRKKTSNPYTYNNYLRFFKVFWNWLIEYQYTRINPFHSLRSKRKTQKERLIIPPAIRTMIRKDLAKEDPNFLTVCLFVFHTLIRPAELVRLKVADINLDTGTIYISGEAAKTGGARITTIPDVFLEHVRNHIAGARPTWYVISEGYFPGKNSVSQRTFRMHWQYMRNRTEIDERYKLYSLRDSGIVQKLNDLIPPQEVMNQAGHSSLAMTTIYARHTNQLGSSVVRSLSSKF